MKQRCSSGCIYSRIWDWYILVDRSDTEPAIRAMIEQAMILSGRSGKASVDATEEEKKSPSVREGLDEESCKFLPSPH